MQERVRQLNHIPLLPRPEAAYILYWAQMNRRYETNHALAYAIQLANGLGLPVLFYEALTCGYPYANDRLHQFVLENVPDTAARLAKARIGFAFHLRKTKHDPNNALYQLANKAAAIVTDDYPTFIARWHNERVPAKIAIPYYAVDSSCVVPMARMEKREYAAYTIRPKIHKLLSQYLVPFAMPKVAVAYTEPPPSFHTHVTRDNIPALVAACEIDHSVKPSTSFPGGTVQAHKRLDHFIAANLKRYANERNQPSAHATSNLSPYLHFGQISALDVALAANQHDVIAGEFLEELIVRRELAFNFARYSPDPELMSNLPDWALKTLAAHDSDPRDYLYSRDQWEQAETHDPLWNAAQNELLLRGKIHGYYRMYWGKKIIEWSKNHQDALQTMVYLHDKYAIDGRDPNTYTGILWCFGLHDRPWTERSVFGMIRFMSGDGMKRKTNSQAYLKEIEFLQRTGKEPHRPL